MEWILIAVIYWGSVSQYQFGPFETKELCEFAQKEYYSKLPNYGSHRVLVMCAETKKVK